jgi:hypothetical protein
MSTPRTHPIRVAIYPDGDAVLVVVTDVFNESAMTSCLVALEKTGIRPREKNPIRMFHVGHDPGITLEQAMTAVRSILEQDGFHVTIGR